MACPTHAPRRVVVLCFPGVQMLDVTGPSEVFSIAERIRRSSYALELVSSAGDDEVEASSGLRLLPDCTIKEAADGSIDTLVVAGGPGVEEALGDERLIGWVADAARRSRRVTSVCTGAFLLAEAGLLDGRRATTHWSACEALSSRYPKVSVEVDPIFVRDGAVCTSAGVSAGIDLALSLVEEDLGGRVASQVAKMLVLFVRRPGGQAQFSRALSGQRPDDESLRELQAWMVDHLDCDLSVTALSERIHMSPRHFARIFATQTGVTPGRYVESLRLERARVLLESTSQTIEDIADRCGFGTVETLRRSFARRLVVSPSDYRERFKEAARA